jgi:hypothetical protein
MVAATAGVDVREGRIDHGVTAGLAALQWRVDDFAPTIMSVVIAPVMTIIPTVVPRIVLDFDNCGV